MASITLSATASYNNTNKTVTATFSSNSGSSTVSVSLTSSSSSSEQPFSRVRVWVDNGGSHDTGYVKDYTVFPMANTTQSATLSCPNTGNLTVHLGLGVGHNNYTDGSDSGTLVRAVAPTINKPSISSITRNTAYASFTVANNGGASIQDHYIDAFTDAACTNKISVIEGSSGTFSGLSANTYYYVRANASNTQNLRGYSSLANFYT